MILERLRSAKELLVDDVWNAEMKGRAIAPIADMLEHDFVEKYLPDASSVTGVFIGSRDRGIVEANAFRLACERQGITPGTVFIIEQDKGTIKKSVDRLDSEAEKIRELLAQDNTTQSFLPVLSSTDVAALTKNDFVEAVRLHKALPPVVFIQADGQDPSIIQAISSQTPDDQALFVMARNVNVNRYHYTHMTHDWGVEIAQRNAQGKSENILAYTTDSWRFGRMLYEMLKTALTGSWILKNHYPGLYAEGVHTEDFSLLTSLDTRGKKSKVGQRLIYPPRLRQSLGKFWIPYSDKYAQVLGKVQAQTNSHDQ